MPGVKRYDTGERERERGGLYCHGWAVYFWDPQCRAELRDYRTLGRKLWHRLSGLAVWMCGREDRRRGLRFNHELDEVRIIDDDNGTVSDSEHEAVGQSTMSGTRTSVRYKLMED